MEIQYLVLISTLSGAIIGGLITIIITIIQKNSEEKRHYKEILIKTSLDNWKIRTELLHEVSKETGRNAGYYPLEDYIVHMRSLIDVLTKNKFTKKDLKNAMQKSKEFTDVLDEFRNQNP